MVTELDVLVPDGTKFRDAIRRRLRELGISAREASRRMGSNVGYLGDVLEGRSKIPESHRILKLAEALEVHPSAIGVVSANSFGAPSLPSRPSAAANGTALMPLYAARYTLEKPYVPMATEPTSHVEPLAMLAHVADAYAVTVPNNMNEPRYLAGETAYVSPAAMVRPGDFVFARRSDGNAILARFESANDDSVSLKCLKADNVEEIALGDLVSLHRIVGAFS